MIIPISEKLSWKNPPLVTVLLILVNVFVLFFIQGNDSRYEEEAWTYYFDSGLAGMESDLYLLHKKGEPLTPEIRLKPDTSDKKKEEAAKNLQKSFNDDAYQQKLKDNQIITLSHPNFAAWRELRTSFESKRNRTVTHNYGFVPADHRPVTFLTSMFMHGGVDHLFGNMIFLWLVGSLLELGIGRIRFLVMYLVGGLLSVSFFWLFSQGSTIPLVGASGAISGIMGTMAVVYRLKKIKVFLTLGFYFNYFRVPALALLPFWIGKELFEMMQYGDSSNVAYLAHVGGLIGGAFLGWIDTSVFKLKVDSSVLDEPKVFDELAPLVDKAFQAMRKLDYAAARIHWQAVLGKAPQHLTAWKNMFLMDKQSPTSPTFAATTQGYLEALFSGHQPGQEVRAVFEEYVALSKKLQLSPQLLVRVAMTLADLGEVKRAEQIVGVLIKKMPEMPLLPTALYKLAAAFERAGQKDKWKVCAQILHQRYPHTTEAGLVAQTLAGR